MRSRIAWNVAANWTGQVSTLLVAFFLTPFILHRLGDTAMGLWFLLTTFTGYYGLLDFGTRNAIIRYVAHHVAKKEDKELGRVIATSMFMYSLVGCAILVITLLASWQLESLFKIEPQWVTTAKLLLLVVGCGAAVSMPLNMFGGVLEGMQRFAWIGGVQTVTSLLRAAAIFFFLQSGFGIITVGVITVLSNILSYLVYWAVVLRLLPQISFRKNLVQRSTFSSLSSFGLVTFWVGIANLFRFQADSFVIGVFISIPAVTIFNIAGRLVRYSSDIVQTVAQVLTPTSSEFDAKGETPRLRRLLLVGNRYSSFVALPIACSLVVLGPTIIRVWVGSDYLASYAILIVLAIPRALYMSQAVSISILYGMARHSVVAKVFIVEGAANLLLSIILLHWYGIMGVALGTSIPLLATSLLFLPRHMCKLLEIPVWRFVVEVYSFPLLLQIPLITALWLADQWIQPTTWLQLAQVCVLGGVTYALALALYILHHQPPLRWKTSQAS